MSVSHDHADHVNGAGIFARRYKIPVYMNKGTYQVAMDKFKNTNINFFTTGKTLQFGSLHVETFPVSHDAVDPVGFIFSQKNGAPEHEARKLGFLTDLGEISSDIIDRLQDVTALVVETNHDEHLLMNGPYPWSLKQRIRSRTGHLSNETAAYFISDIVNSTGISEVTIAHLSEKNNEPNLAADTVRQQVDEECGTTITVNVASQHEPTHIIDF